MKLQLLITEKEIKHYNTETKTKYIFTVIDLDRSKQYPQNFVSLLPKNIKATAKPANIFEELFGNKSLEMAKYLLEEALKTRPNSKIKQAIRRRLELLVLKQKNKIKCQNCGNSIKQSRNRVKPYKFCYECYRKGYTKQ